MVASLAGIKLPFEDKETEQALRALENRPKFNIALQVYLAVIISLVIVAYNV